MKPIHYKILLLLSCVLPVASCKKFISIEKPITQIERSAIFSNDQAALSALSGLYSLMANSFLSVTDGGMSIYGGLVSDELYPTSPSTDYDPFRSNSLIATTGSIYNRFWLPAYQRVYHANSLLEGIAGSTAISEGVKKQIEGEARFVRALHYFYLVNLFGDVPLVVNTDYGENAVKERSAVSRVYEQMVTDLQEAERLLPANYVSAGRVRPNKWAAAALLARVYLYLKDWANAEAQANMVLGSGVYSLVPTASIGNIFQSSSNETIWQLMKESSNTSEGSSFIPANTSLIPFLALTNYVLNSFEAGDLRKQNWTGKNTVNGQDYHYPYKYKVRSSATVSENLIVLRLAEVYLIRAEAKAMQNNITGAQDDLNRIRNRAGLGNRTASTANALLTAIEKERQVEFFAEWGHRWLDLKRLGRADAVLGSEKGSVWQSTDALFPIPQTEIEKNPFLRQNAGY
jgi:hypothetical protein